MFKKVPAETKLLLLAVAVALAVHLLLFGLFRYQPRRAAHGELPVTPPVLLQLQKPENRELALWIRHHDPSLIAAPNAQCGFGTAAQDPRWHATVNDLPQVPALAQPVTTLPVPPPAPVSVEAPIPASAVRPRPVAAAKGVAVTLNGRDLPELARALSRIAAERKTVGTVELEIAPSVQPGLSGPCRIVRSSGIPEWDRTVQSVLAAADLPCGAILVEAEVQP